MRRLLERMTERQLNCLMFAACGAGLLTAAVYLVVRLKGG